MVQRLFLLEDNAMEVKFAQDLPERVFPFL